VIAQSLGFVLCDSLRVSVANPLLPKPLSLTTKNFGGTEPVVLFLEMICNTTARILAVVQRVQEDEFRETVCDDLPGIFCRVGCADGRGYECSTKRPILDVVAVNMPRWRLL
jgi:hypothetical protein